MASYTIKDIKEGLETASDYCKNENYAAALPFIISARARLLGLPDHEWSAGETGGEDRVEYHRQCSDLESLIKFGMQVKNVGSKRNFVDLSG